MIPDNRKFHEHYFELFRANLLFLFGATLLGAIVGIILFLHQSDQYESKEIVKVTGFPVLDERGYIVATRLDVLTKIINAKNFGSETAKISVAGNVNYFSVEESRTLVVSVLSNDANESFRVANRVADFILEYDAAEISKRAESKRDQIKSAQEIVRINEAKIQFLLSVDTPSEYPLPVHVFWNNYLTYSIQELRHIVNEANHNIERLNRPLLAEILLRANRANVKLIPKKALIIPSVAGLFFSISTLLLLCVRVVRGNNK